MKRLLPFLALLLGGAIASPALAQSFTGQTTGQAVMRSGPDVGYPQVAILPNRASVHIYGCVDDWSWCDVQWNQERGWVSAGMLNTNYLGRHYSVSMSGYDLGIPIMAFIINEYWHNYYRHRPWYRDASRWYSYRPIRSYHPTHRHRFNHQRPHYRAPIVHPGVRTPPHVRRPAPPHNRTPHYRDSNRGPGNRRPDFQRPSPPDNRGPGNRRPDFQRPSPPINRGPGNRAPDHHRPSPPGNRGPGTRRPDFQRPSPPGNRAPGNRPSPPSSRPSPRRAAPAQQER